MQRAIASSGIQIRPGIDLCQSDLPLDWYQPEFKPYAEEYLALPDRQPETVLPWLDSYVRPAIEHFGDSLLLLAHFYMGGEIVKLVERYGGSIGDSYALALMSQRSPRASIIVQSAVHFMAEAVAILAEPHQQVWITNPKAGCTMEMMAKEDAVAPIADQLIERCGEDLIVVAYMNTSGRVKALAGRTGGATCTSSNAHLVLDWARRRASKVLFVPDRHLGQNVADRIGIPDERVAVLPWDWLGDELPRLWPHLDRADLLLWGAYCGVHTVFRPEHVRAWRERGWTVLVHPESPREVVRAAHGSGSTSYLWNAVMRAEQGSRFAIGTEGHFVRNLREQASLRGIHVEHLAAVPLPGALPVAGCGCATMSRNDPPHLAGLLDLLRKGTPPDLNRVLPGDEMNERTGVRERLDTVDRDELIVHARRALRRMIEITEGGSAPPASERRA
ncbi:MAG: quinolinate synthase NadA [Phycisphaeraceae bacterium]|nr:quinolinate synthase NadA [Phycisphaeraceae bacterium]